MITWQTKITDEKYDPELLAEVHAVFTPTLPPGLEKLDYERWLELSALMDNVPDPDTIYTLEGWHYRLMNWLVNKAGVRTVGRWGAYHIGKRLVDVGFASYV